MKRLLINKIKIVSLMFLGFIIQISCNQKKEDQLNIKEDVTDEIKLVSVENKDTISFQKIRDTTKTKKVIKVPSYIDDYSETIIFYEDYINKAYSQKDFDNFFEINREYLDTLISKYENSLEISN